MMSTNNILSPANGEPIIVPSQDVVLGIYYLTREKINVQGEGMFFSSIEEVDRAYELGHVALHAKVKLRLSPGQIVDTTVGRALLSKILPKGLDYQLVNSTLNKKAISNLINETYRKLGLKATVILADQLMYTGFSYATKSGTSICSDDLVIPEEKHQIINEADKEVKEIEEQFSSGLVTFGERYNKVIDIWSRTNDKVAKAMMDKLSHEEVTTRDGKSISQESFNSVYMMADSGGTRFSSSN